MSKILVSSEFWMAVLAGLGQLGVTWNLWKQDDYNNLLLPAITYIVGRVISKVAKSAAA